MICPKCGQNIEDGGFCPFCGFEFTKENIQNIAETTKVEPENTEYINMNNNPLSPVGRIERLPYLLTKFGLIVTYVAAQMCMSYYKTLNNNSLFYVYIALMLLFLIAGIFAASKRLRDIKWSQWCLLIWLIPILGIVVGAPLLFIKSKYDQ